MKKVLYLALVVLLLAGVMLTSCSSTPATSALTATQTASATLIPQYGGTLKLTTARGPGVIGYPSEITSQAWEATSLCIESLFGFDENFNFKPVLATDYKFADDLLSATISLRQGVKFHDGTDFNAQAAKWNLDLALKYRKAETITFKSIDVIDDYTIRVNLKQFENTFAMGLGTVTSYMVSPTAFENNGRDWVRNNPVGTGPFIFSSFERDVSLKYTRNDNYWGGKPYLDAVEYYFLADPNVQEIALQKGEVDVLMRANPLQAMDLSTAGNFVFYKKLPNKVDSLQPSGKDPEDIFADQRVREAIEYSVNRTDIAETLGYGVLEPISQLSPTAFVGYDSNLTGRPFDPAKARQLLAEAGHPDGIKITLYLEKGNHDPDVAVAIQSDLKEGGIEAELVTLETAKFNQQDVDGWKNSIMYYSDGAIPPITKNHVRQFASTSIYKVDVYKPTGWDEIINKQHKSPDPEVQRAATQEMLRFMYDHAMVIPLWTISQPYITRPEVHDPGFCVNGPQQLWAPAKAWKSK